MAIVSTANFNSLIFNASGAVGGNIGRSSPLYDKVKSNLGI